MIRSPTDSNTRLLSIAVLVGSTYVAAVFIWALSTGVRFAAEDPGSMAIALAYSGVGLFLIAAIPVYLVGRFTLVSPLIVALWSLGNTIYLRWYVPRPHDALASYVTVWPIFVGLIVVASLLEVAVRIGTHRAIGRFGLRSLR